jgi:prepilin-type N-terminal cleavage/methylation domain-containing protein/prepilin-type processing-associated H-X9-DG protein
MHTSNKNVNSGFTLVELLVVIAVIGILVSMLFPAVQAVRGAARQSSCLNNLRNVVLAAHNFEASNQSFPKADDGEGTSLFVELTSFLDQQYLYERSVEDLDASISETTEDRLKELSSIAFETLFCPATAEQDQKANVIGQGEFTTHYYAVAGPTDTAVSSDGTRTYTYNELSPEPVGGSVSLNGMFSPDKKGHFKYARGSRDIRDGASNTIIFGEISYSSNLTATITDRGGWAFGSTYDTAGDNPVKELYVAKSVSESINQKKNTNVNELAFGSNHNGGANFGFADGSTRFIRDKISLDIFKTISSIDRLEAPERLDD